MAATERWLRGAAHPSLRALTAAALALPGLSPARAHADDGEISFQYGRYQEGERDLSGVDSRFEPIEVDNLLADAQWTLFDRWTLGFHYQQDTWSGATPIATAPVVFVGNRPTAPDGVSGATPFIEGELFLNERFEPLELDALGDPTNVADTELVHTLSSASPETRHQVGAEIGYDWDFAELSFGGGVSLENDYVSRYGELGGALELDQGNTRLALQTSYTDSETQARLDHDAVPYIDTSAYAGEITVFPSTGGRKLEDDRRDVGVRAEITRILDRDTLAVVGFGYARAGGYLENPYKVVEVGFIDPAQQLRAPPGGYFADVHALLEQRPNVRHQWRGDARLVRYVAPLDASLQLTYGFQHDSWDLSAHTFEASWGQPLGTGLTLTPRLRFYSQDAADFYRPYLLSQQAYETIVVDPDTGDVIGITPFDPSLLPSHFSSDARLSGFGALSGGVTLSKRFARGIVLDAGFELYRHRGDWKLGGGGEGDYADFDSWLVSAGVRFAMGESVPDESSASLHSDAHPVHAQHAAPAGVLLAHRLEHGQWMFGVRYGLGLSSGDVLHGTNSASDAEILANGCDGAPCSTEPDEMTMHMVMLDLAYAPTPWLTLMLMPSFVDMEMDLRTLDGAVPDEHGGHGHETGGVGDTGLFALLRLFETPEHRMHLGLGLGAPTGSVGEKMRRTHQQDRGYTHYGMQLGSGTWDFLPSLTYTGAWRRVSFGAQASGAVRLEHENDSGYAQGDLLQLTGWGGFSLTRWLSATARGVYTLQGGLRGEYDRRHETSGPMDFPSSYGGQWWDVGLGLAAAAPGGPLAGQRLALEWLQPVVDDVDGYQQGRTGTLVASWSLEF